MLIVHVVQPPQSKLDGHVTRYSCQRECDQVTATLRVRSNFSMVIAPTTVRHTKRLPNQTFSGPSYNIVSNIQQHHSSDHSLQSVERFTT
jgi:hypothetical protein